MYVLKDYYNINDNNYVSCYGVNWFYQTFRPTESYDLVLIKLLVRREGPDGNVILSLRNADVNHLPTGSDLISVNVNLGDISQDFEWFSFFLSFNLICNIEYCIVVRVPDGNIFNKLIIREDNAGSTYSGYRGNSVNGGSSWTVSSTRDILFETYNWEDNVMANFEVIYQAAGAGTGKTVQLDVYKPDKSKDNDQSGVMVEIGTTGRYYKAFDADAPNWSVQCSDNVGGKCVKNYDKSAYESAQVITLVGDVQTAVNNVSDAIATLDTALTGVDSKVDIIGGNITDIKAVTDVLNATLAGIESKIDALESPPMIA